MTGNLEAVMKVMRFASNRGNSHFSFTSIMNSSQEDPLMYPMLPQSKFASLENIAYVRDLNSMIPVCFVKMSEVDKMKIDRCELFQPVVTDLGVCSSFNLKPSLEMLNPSFFTESFGKAFKEDLKPNQKLRYGEKEVKILNFFTVVNSKSPRQDHLKARLNVDGDIQPPSKFLLSISTHNEYFQTKDSSFAIKSGHKTTINVNMCGNVGFHQGLLSFHF